MPNYDVLALARKICANEGWNLSKVYFYTGVPSSGDDKRWHNFWSQKTLTMLRQGVSVFTRELRYREKKIKIPGGIFSAVVPEEKGIDVRIALDIIRMTRRKEFDVALVFSQDQDFSEVAKELTTVAKDQNRWVKIASAFPFDGSRTSKSNPRGINGSDWIKIDRTLYDACLDHRDYFSTVAVPRPQRQSRP